ncbi:hypothetical protein RND71_009398 [Anisodus tanguticus]|uniref:Uncharacterized protein n=1 Tax=Anisodus tanguticus TaxID=243964 RepID=A0AAE1VH68_9SOLA|nr:hypothetical protein RND71_009398 [Anisodus tanguticus]
MLWWVKLPGTGVGKYLKSHPGGPAITEFDWGTAETPRRSTRISGKAMAVESAPLAKRSRKSSASKKDVKAVNDVKEKHDDGKDENKDIEEDAEKKDEMRSSDVDAVKENQVEKKSEGQTEDDPSKEAEVEKDVKMTDNAAEKKDEMHKENQSEVQTEDGKGEDAPSEVAEIDKDVKMADNVQDKVKQKPTATAEEKKHQPEQEQSDEQQNVAATKSTEGKNALMNSDIIKKVDEEVTDNVNKADEAANA